MGEPTVKQKANNNTLIFRFNSESITPVSLRLKIEINCREHFTVLGWATKDFSVNSDWFKGKCNISTYHLEEMIGTKIRALYQRKKGRDLYDLYKALTHSKMDIDKVINCYHEYMKFSVNQVPTRKQFILNMEEKMMDEDFLGDTQSLLQPDEKYDPKNAWELVKRDMVEKI